MRWPDILRPLLLSLLWHLSRPLPVSGKLPACSQFHQEPQEMSLRECWSLIKNKWMGCPRDRVNGQRIAGAGATKCRRKWAVEVESKVGEPTIKFEPITMFLCSDESKDGRKTRTSCDKKSSSKWNGEADQLNPFLQRAPGRHGAYRHGPCTLSSVLVRVRAEIANIDLFLLSALDTITLMPWMEAQTFQACHTSGLLANH